MKVIKAVDVDTRCNLVSSFASGKWRKRYAEGVETKPDVGYLFAFPSNHLEQARGECGGCQYWLAEAEVVGKILFSAITTMDSQWHDFWAGYRLKLRRPRAEYLLCSSITLIRRCDGTT